MRQASRWLLVFAVAAVACARTAQAAQPGNLAPGDSLQAAIDKAPDGATSKIPAGVFAESITITRPLTLEGAGWEKTVVGPQRQTQFTQKQKDEFFSALESTSDPQERVKIAVAFASGQTPPTLAVKNARGVTIRGIRFRGPPTGNPDGSLTPESLVVFQDAHGAAMSDCAIIGPFMNGVAVTNGSDVKIEKCLVAAMWGTGVAVYAERGAAPAKLHLLESDVRNCYHRGVTINSEGTTIERCRISGSAWHGIRYDHCSPKVLDNHIFANARSGIYASGKTAATVRGNVFWRNEMDAMSCWFANADNVEGNTIAGNLREGISVLGGSKTTLARNVFVDNPIGVLRGKIASRGQTQEDAPMGEPTIEANVFFKNQKDQVVGDAVKPLPAGNESADPKLAPPAEDFKLAADSPARKLKAGAVDPIPFASPFAIQPEEKSIIPESDTRDYSKWKKVASAR